MSHRGLILYTAADVRDAVLAVAEVYGIAPAAALRIAAREVPEVSGDATASARSDADELPPVLRDTDPAPPPSDH